MDKRRMMFPLPGIDRQQERLERVLFVDPGLGGTGWAFFAWINTLAKKPEAPEASGVFTKAEGDWLARCRSLAAEMAGTAKALGAQDAVLEMPELWLGSATSFASATHKAKRETPDLFKLAYLVGAIGTAVGDQTGNLPILIGPDEWKGQLDKEALKARVCRALGADVKLHEHEWDAVGMGLSAQGRL